MERRTIRDIAASAVAHVSLVALVILISEVHPFHAAPTETVAVDIVTTDEVEEAAHEPSPPPQMPAAELAATARTEAPSPASPQPPQQVGRVQQQPSPAPRAREAEAAEPVQPVPAAPSYVPPEPDVTVKYGVMLGLPEGLPPLPKESGDKRNDGGDARASTSADLSSSVIAQFRHHLRKCAKLPASVAPSDNLVIKLRAFMTPDGRLAADPILIEASASAKGPILMQSAKSALQACQPYAMLPAERYGEWKVMDLTFTPRDFDAS